MKRKISLICTFVLAISVCATVTLSSFADARQSDVSYASVEQYYNGNDEVADMNTTTERNPVDDYLGDKVETTASGGLLDSIGGGGFDIDIGIGDIFSDAKDVIGSIVGGVDSDSSSSGSSSSSGNNVVYIDPVPAGTQNYQASDMNSTQTQSQTQAQTQRSESVSADVTVSVGTSENSLPASEVNTIVTAPETIGTDNGGDEDDNSKLGIIIAIIAAIWCVAIIIVIVLFLMKKKKAERKAESEKDLEFTYAAKKNDTDTAKTSDMSLSDLFEEANKD